MMKKILLSCLLAPCLAAFSGCASDAQPSTTSSTTTTEETTVQPANPTTTTTTERTMAPANQ